MSKILVVHPDAGISGQVSSLLMKKNHEVAVFQEGRPALAAFSRVKPEFVLLNDVLPDTNGFTLFGKIMKADREAKVLILSVLADQQEEGGVPRFGIRSFRPDEVVGVVEKLHKDSREAKRPPDAPKPLIAVIDDDPAVIEMIESVLALSGYKVASAENGKMGLELVRKARPQLVLLDVAMPEMSGPETLKRIREFDPRVGVVMVTGDGRFEMMEECRAYGAFDYLVKPFSMEYLLFCVYSRILLSTI
ncbi:MAG: response regulator [Elusimicrobia bacterium]|nr:response regulator [Elusimicrobiota bacterium]